MSRVLIVDDEPAVIGVLKRVLEREGHAVFQTADATQAAVMAEQHAVDVAIVDYNLVCSDGLTVLREIRARWPSCGRVLMSGHLEMPVIITAVNDGCVHRVLNKPISTRDLRAAVKSTARIRQQLAADWERMQDRNKAAQQEEVCALIGSDQLQLALQPILSMDSGLLVAHEALMRSQHETLSNPMLVLQAAERCDMILDVGAAVAQRAGSWMPQLPDSSLLFVNLHPEELREPERIVRNLAPLRPWSGRVVLEITEHSRARPGPEWISAIQLLRGQGFSIAVDDLGSGYNSLGVLASLQPDYIKIDMGIVRDVDCDPYKQRLIGLLTQLADSTGSTVVAEGVETPAEAHALRDIGVHLVQGYLFGKPSLAPDFASYPTAEGFSAITPPRQQTA